MLTLTQSESRILGVLIEKAQTTPNQYPLTLNALVTGCSQKNNRDPVYDMDEDTALEAIDGLKAKGLAREAIMAGSRVNKFRHTVREALQISVAEMAFLAELLLRGPQAPGELRSRAERMVPPGSGGAPLDTVEHAQAVLDSLAARREPLVKRLEHRPGERAPRWAQLLCPDLHPHADEHPPGAGAQPAVSRSTGASLGGDSALLARIERLEAKVEELSVRISRMSDPRIQ